MAYTPLKGIFQDNVMQLGGDYGQYGTPLEQYDRGMWKADPNVNYGTPPEPGMVPVFDKQGNHYGWEQPHDYSAGGSGLFGSFGEAKNWRGYYFDENGQLQAGTGGVTPSKSGMTNIMSYAMPIAMAAGLGAGAAGGAFGGAGTLAAPGAEAGLVASSPEVLGGLYGAAGEPLIGGMTLAEAGAAGAVPGVAGSAAGGGSIFDGIMELLPSGVKDAAGALPWEQIIKGGVGSVIGRNQDRQARIADQDYRDLETMNAANLFNSANTYASGLTSLADKYKGAYDPFYAQVDNGVATSSIDPVTGKVGFNLNAPYQQQRDRLFGAAGDVFGQMKDFNPQTFATERYNAAQNLLRPGDQVAEQNLLQQLFDKGGFGLTTNTPAAATPLPGGGVAPGTGSVGINPYVSTFANSRNQRNAQMSYDSLNQGENYLDNLIKRQRGLFGDGAAIDAAGSGVMRDAFSASDNFMRDRRTAAGFGYNAGREALQIPYNAQREYLNAVTGANQRFMGNSAAADATKSNNYWDVAQKLPWGDIWGKVSGWLF